MCNFTLFENSEFGIGQIETLIDQFVKVILTLNLAEKIFPNSEKALTL